MKTTPSYEALLAEVMALRESDRRKSERIAYIERLLFRSKSDKLASKAAPANQPGLFDGLLDEAYDEQASELQKVSVEIKAESEKRRKSAKTVPARPSRYQYHGLEERRREVNPEGLVMENYDRIGQDETRILHREAAKLWVDTTTKNLRNDF